MFFTELFDGGDVLEYGDVVFAGELVSVGFFQIVQVREELTDFFRSSPALEE